MTPGTIAAPGLYVRGRETAGALRVPTAVTGFVGIARRGPIGVPQSLRSFGEYLEVFGDFVAWGYLAESVYAFFQNGGETCWVVRAADIAPKSASGLCPPDDRLDKARSATVLDWNGNPTLVLEALNEGAWGNALSFAIAHESSRELQLTTLRAPLAAPDAVLRLESVLDIAPEAIQISSATDPFLRARHSVQSVDLANRELTLAAPAGASFPAGSTVSGRGWRLELRCGEELEVFDPLSLSPEHPRYAPSIVNGDVDVQSYVERRRRGHSILARLEHLSTAGSWGAKPPSTSAPLALSGGGDGFTFASVGFQESGGPGEMRLFAKADRGSAAHELAVEVEPFETRTALPIPGASVDLHRVVVEDSRGFAVGDELTLSFEAPDGSTPTVASSIVSIDEENGLGLLTAFPVDFPAGSRAAVLDRFDIAVRRASALELEERLRNLSGDPLSPRWFRTIVEAESALLCALDPGAALGALAGEKNLSGGRDPGDIDPRYYTGYEADGATFAPPGALGRPLGLAALEAVGEIGLVAIPDLVRVGPSALAGAQSILLHHCAKLQTRFALLDPPLGTSAAEIAAWRLELADERLAKHGALYFPWLSAPFLGALRSVPPSGFVAGSIADSDRRRGVGKAPANAPLKGVVELAAALDRELQHELNQAGVNCIRKFEDGQVRLYGARTLSRDPRSLYVNARRVVASAIQALSTRLAWAVFEPNDARLWQRLESSVRGFLESLVAKGLTAGERAEESFYVRCGAEENPRESVDSGHVLAEIGLAVAAPAEFIVLTARKSPEALHVVEEDV